MGVKDSGEIVGVDEKHIESIKKDFATVINNPQKINPPLYLSVETIEIEGKKILRIHVPVSKSVHTLNGKIFDRSNDSDINITGQNANIPHAYGELNPSNFTPYQKTQALPRYLERLVLQMSLEVA